MAVLSSNAELLLFETDDHIASEGGHTLLTTEFWLYGENGSDVQKILKTDDPELSKVPFLKTFAPTENSSSQSTVTVWLIAADELDDVTLSSIGHQMSAKHGQTLYPVLLSDKPETVQKFKYAGGIVSFHLKGQSADSIRNILELSEAMAQQHHALKKSGTAQASNKPFQIDTLYDLHLEVNTSGMIETVHGRKADSFKNKVGHNFISCIPETERDNWKEIFMSGVLLPESKTFETAALKTPNRISTYELRLTPIQKQSKVQGYYIHGIDRSENVRLKDKVQNLRDTDMLTGLLNRGAFMKTLEDRMQEESSVCMALLNIDCFHVSNSIHGPEMGDMILEKMAEGLGIFCRKKDIVARLGGDTFAILFDDSTEESAWKQAEEIQEAFLNMTRASDWPTEPLTLSIGIAESKYARNHGALFQNTMLALNEAKHLGKNRICRYHNLNPHNAMLKKRVEMVSELTTGLHKADKIFKLYKQPIEPLGSSSKGYHEILLRVLKDGTWRTAAHHIDVANDHGLSIDIDLWVTENVVKELLKEPETSVFSVNLSPRTLEKNDAVERIIDLIEDAGVARQLCIELTETCPILNFGTVRNNLLKLQSIGVKIALDDCGAGQASLHMIRDMPLDIIKIDGKFIKDLHRGSTDEIFVRALRDIARKMGLTIVAEMVEREDTMQKLRTLGIDYVQGYAIGRPEPIGS
ncbi:MAG: bifunctional diguanylate cyclase/phosphodiesterase [Pseudomonadota bacterium]|nr:bifunctional diguanylate cyclase/phosphodiesterase [Pseudomonadota bacterium]